MSETDPETQLATTRRHLAALMMEWEQYWLAMDELEATIQDIVLGLAETQTVGNVRASYSGGRKTYDYEGAGMNAPTGIIAGHVKTVTTTDWRAVCKEAEITEVSFIKSEPRVTVKLLK